MPLTLECICGICEADIKGIYLGKLAEPGILNSVYNTICGPSLSLIIFEQNGYRENQRDCITFKCFSTTEPNENNADLKSSFSIEKKFLQEYLANAKNLDDGKKGIYFEHSQMRNSLADHPSLFMIGYILGGGPSHAKLQIEMVFDQNDKLEKLRVREKYNGDRILFSATNLKSKYDILQERRAIAQQHIDANIIKEQHERFKF